jgi:DNA-binding CsgD family transcriptional regulator
VTEDDDIVLALQLRDPALTERLTELLGAVPGLRLVGPGAPADAVLSDAALSETTVMPDGADAAGLTPREREVLALLGEGVSNRAIAERLGISVHTAKFHVGRLIDKLDATGRTDAVAHAARTGVLHL